MLISYGEFQEQLPKLSHFLNRNGFENIKIQTHQLTTTYLTSSSSLKYDFLIHYNVNYQHPVLHFKLYELSTNIDGFESIIPIRDPKRHFPTDYDFEIGLREHDQGIWWFIHPCDTDLILQNVVGSPDALIDWFSVYCGCFIGLNLSLSG